MYFVAPTMLTITCKAEPALKGFKGLRPNKFCKLVQVDFEVGHCPGEPAHHFRAESPSRA